MITRRQFVTLTAGVCASATLASCIGAPKAIEKYKLGETVQTDILEFTLKSATLAQYAERSLKWDKNTLEVESADHYIIPTDTPSEYGFKTNKGRTLICLEYSYKSNDREKVEIASNGMKVTYNGSEVDVKGYKDGKPDGDSGFYQYNAIIKVNDGDRWFYPNQQSIFIPVGETGTFRNNGIAKFEPKSLADSFDLRVSVLDSSGEKQDFVYTIG